MGLFTDFIELVTGDVSDDPSNIFNELEFDFETGQFIEDPNFIERVFNYLTDTERGRGLGALLSSMALSSSGLLDPKIPQTGYAGGIPDYRAMRQQVPVATGIEQINETVRPMGTTRMEAGNVDSTGRVLPLMYDPNRRPGSGGRRYFTDIQYVPTGRDMGEDTAIDDAGIAAAQAQQDQQAYDLLRRNLSNLAREERSQRVGALPLMAGPMPEGPQGQPQDPVPTGPPVGQLPPDQDEGRMAQGGIAAFKEGKRVSGNRFGQAARDFFEARGEKRFFPNAMPEVRQAVLEAKNASPEEKAEIIKDMELNLMREYFPDEYRKKGYDPRAYKIPANAKPFGDDRKGMAQGGIAALKSGKYLDGSTDGMADEIPATINGTQPAALSDGEFVIPADVVSHLGNGNSDAGARVLEQMMARVRKERTGNKEQGKEIQARKMLPA